ncbi:abasic site processing protein HMCES isoform X2 [Daktulosphaira vitifoliae]|nr:abasic site processing protein HMCES isoform X2 [Daktulosphaira vitifoliae]XP_050524545.1 abasic site processing protein HMCES isoform X2 [Daktulosphaira vitifoliae]
MPKWHHLDNGGRKFIPSNNIAPTDITPILISGEKFEETSTRIIAPMVWGMIPPWHKGSLSDHGLSSNNCRIENITTSKLYEKPLIEGKRCVVICEGFYEWQTISSSKKKPYFIYSSQEKEIYEKKNWECAQWSENLGWQGPSLLKLAGLYNKWKSLNGDIIYSYSIITMKSNSMFCKIHHRIPAILEDDQQINDWLDSKRISSNKAILLLQQSEKLKWYEVSTQVNNSRNKNDNCSKPLSKIINKSEVFMNSWLSGVKNKRIGDDQPSKMKKTN